jgi:hypothetical protein
MKHACALLFFTWSASVVCVNALVTCPPVSTTAIQCYSGSVYSGAIPAGGYCDCSCYSGDGSGFWSVSNSAGCSGTACATKYPAMCGSNPSTPTYTPYSTDFVSTPQLAPASVGAICGSYTISCSATNDCAGLSTGSTTIYLMFTDYTDNGVTTTAASNCGDMATAANGAPTGSYTVNSLCSTSTCNAPKTSSASSRVTSLTYLAMVVIVVMLF